MNLIFELYFTSVTRICIDTRCKNWIISHIITTFFIFLVDTYDIKALQYNKKRIKSLFNPIIILDNVEYHFLAYYLMPHENHFAIIFSSQLSCENIKFDSWHLYDDLVVDVFEIKGDLGKF